MGYQKISNEDELKLVEEYRNGASVSELMSRYGYKTKKSITDKVKKYYPNEYQNIIQQAQDNRRGYTYSLSEIKSPFDAYLIGLMLTDGYLLSDRDGIGLDMVDEDAIAFIAKGIGTTYKAYSQTGKQTRYRVLINRPGIQAEVARYGLIKNKTYIIPAPQFYEQEIKYLPYVIRGIIDGDGCVSKTSYGGAQFYIVSASIEFIKWIEKILTENFFMEDLHIRKTEENLYRIETANQFNILKLIAIVYNKPFGMNRKYIEIRKTFRDYNKDFFIGNNEIDGIVQTATE